MMSVLVVDRSEPAVREVDGDCASYPYSCLGAAKRHAVRARDWAASGDEQRAMDALGDFESIHAELRST